MSLSNMFLFIICQLNELCPTYGCLVLEEPRFVELLIDCVCDERKQFERGGKHASRALTTLGKNDRLLVPVTTISKEIILFHRNRSFVFVIVATILFFKLCSWIKKVTGGCITVCLKVERLDYLCINIMQVFTCRCDKEAALLLYSDYKINFPL